MGNWGLAGSAKGYADNVRALTLDEALFADGGYRSILGVLKHMGGWAHVYCSYAFDADPKHWNQTSWPRGLRDTVEPTREYLDEVIAWAAQGIQGWDSALAGLDDAALDEERPLHWRAEAPLWQIVLMAAQHVVYHTGELNMLLSISRQEAWEYSEEVEENHISTFGHGIRALWMTDEQARVHEDALRAAHEAVAPG